MARALAPARMRTAACTPGWAPTTPTRAWAPGSGRGSRSGTDRGRTAARNVTKGAPAGAPEFCMPSMGADWEVKVLRGLGHRNPREPQGDAREGNAESSGERTDGLTNRNRIQGGAGQSERANDREALVTKDQRRKSGGRVGKASVLIWG